MRSWTWVTTMLLLAPAPCLASTPGEAAAGTGADLEHGKAATADASPVEPGVAEVEIAYTPSWQRRAGSSGVDAGDEGHAHSWSSTLTYGVATDLDVNLGTGVTALYDTSLRRSDPAAPVDGLGLGDVSVGARWRFFHRPERGLELAVVAEAVVPAGTRASRTTLGVSQGYWSAYAAVVATRDLGRATLNGEVGFGAPLSDGAGGLRSIVQVNAAAGVQVFSWLQPEFELNYGASFGTASQIVAATAGVVAPFGSGQRVVAAVQRDLWGFAAAERTAAVLAFKTAL